MASRRLQEGASKRHTVRVRGRLTAVLVGLAASATLAVACAPGSGALGPRYVAVHNALASLGMAQTGPLLQGSLAEGRDARFAIDLVAQCSTLAAVGGQGVEDLDLTLLDPEGKPVAHDTTSEPQAVVRVCVDRPGRYAIVVRASRGAGDFLAAAWVGGVGPSTPPGAGSASASSEPNGTCEAPIPLVAGVVNGTTTRGEAENEGSCSATSAPEIVYRMDLDRRQRVVLEVDPHFDSVLYVRRADCSDASAEIACNDDAPHEHASRVDEVLDPGTYFVFVDGYQSANGAYKLTAAMASAPTARELCERAQDLVAGAGPAAGSAQGSFDHVESTCGQGAHGPDTAYHLRVPTRARARLTERSTDFPPVLHVRRTCADAQTELACADGAIADGTAVVSAVLDPGDYGVFADAQPRDAHGRYTLAAELAPAAGAGTTGDACADAVPLTVRDDEIVGDTFSARDDVAPSCAAAGGADVVYRLEVPRRERIEVEIAREESEHVVSLARACGDAHSEVGCGHHVDAVVAPGTYYVVVDAKEPTSVGRFALHVAMHDTAPQEAACRTAPALPLGHTVRGTTVGAGDRFALACAGPAGHTHASDRVYRLVVARRGRVRLELAAPGWAAVLGLRSACLDGTTARPVELACQRSASGISAVERELEPGTYYVVVDGFGGATEGAFQLTARALP